MRLIMLPKLTCQHHQSSQYVYVSLSVHLTHSNGRNSFMIDHSHGHTYQGKRQKANKDLFCSIDELNMDLFWT